MPEESKYEGVPIAEASGSVGTVQMAIGAAVLVYALVLIVRPPRTRQGLLFGIGLVAAFLPVAVGHGAMLVAQIRTLGEMSQLGPDASDRDKIKAMEQASVHTWVGWTASGLAFPAMLLARWRFPKTPVPAGGPPGSAT